MSATIEVSEYSRNRLEALAEDYGVDVAEIVFRLLTWVEEDAPDLDEYSW